MSAAGRPLPTRTANVILAAALLIWACAVAEVRPARLFDAASARAFAGFVHGMFPPDLSAAFLRVVVAAIVRTLAIAIAATTLAVLVALPLGYLATPSLFRRGVLVASEPLTASRRARSAASLAGRGGLRFLRAVPDVMWGVLFVVAIGLGPLAGTLALAVACAGVLGRVYADVFESVDQGPVEAVLATGAGRFAVFVTAIWPQALGNVIAYTLYSFECAVRAASVLGFIGAGGIGYEINISMRLFEYGQVLTLIAAYVGVVFLSEFASRTLRRRFSQRFPGRRLSHPLRAVIAFALLLTMGASFVSTGFVQADLHGAATRAIRFASSLWPPDVSREFVSSLPKPILQTIAIAVVGTTWGGLLAGALTIPAAITPLSDPSATRAGWTVLRTLLALGARGLLALLRSIPELLWALLCIVAIGVGPFAGTIAVSLHSAGVLGKLYADTLEEVPQGPVDAVRASGAGAWACLVWAVLPQARATLTTYTLLRFEANLRAATVVGLIGGGGIGLVIYNDVQLGFYDRVGTLIAVVYGLIAATDWATDRLRIIGSSRNQRIVDPPALALLAATNASSVPDRA
jgi:phosphonate transport system permease protein